MRLSASQLSDFDYTSDSGCMRKWAWAKIHKLKGPEKESQRFGKEVHRQIENYYKHGIPLDLTTPEGNAALAGMHLLPQPSNLVSVEGEFRLAAWGHIYLGYKDLALPGEVLDHKTTGNFKWAKTAEQLETDIQACLYAAHVLVSTGANSVKLQWTYFKSKKAYKAQAVRLTMTRESPGLIATLEKIRRLSAEMQAISDLGLKALDLPPNARACEAFGGCPYRQLCNLTTEQKVRSIMSSQEPKAAWMQQLQELQAAQGGAGMTVNPPMPGGPPPGAPLTPDGTQWWDGAAWQPVVTVAPPPPPPPPMPPVQVAPPPPMPQLPPAPPPPPMPAPVVAPAPQLSPDGKWQLVSGAWVAYSAAPPPPMPEMAERAKRGPGRPKKDAAGNAVLPDSSKYDVIADAYETMSKAFQALADAWRAL